MNTLAFTFFMPTLLLSCTQAIITIDTLELLDSTLKQTIWLGLYKLKPLLLPCVALKPPLLY